MKGVERGCPEIEQDDRTNGSTIVRMNRDVT